MNDVTLRMIKLAAQGFFCSQILLFLGLEAQGKQNPDLIRAMNALAGGLGFSGDTCGALSGGACLLGLYAGRGSADEETDPKLELMINQLVDWFTREYTTLYGGIRCNDILADDPTNQRIRCPGIVKNTYDKVASLLVENGFDLSEGR
ncbi:MAG: C-GCAxxG-C-C family protein [Deltaproteobacteria bacterium]